MSVQQQIDRLIALRAAELFEAIRAGEMDVSSDEFRRWISESPKHVDAFMTISGQAPLIREVLQARQGDLQALLQKKAPSVVHLSPAVVPQETAAPPSHRKSRAAWVSVAAALAILIVSLWVLPSRWQHLETGAGEQRAVTLADGSIVNLNAQSSVEVRLRERARDLRLVRGEAIFKVAHDKNRPFNVSTPSAVVKAVGTEFAISVRGEGTRVTVLEGKVEVAAAGAERNRRLESSGTATATGDARSLVTAVSAGQEAHVARGGAVEFEPHADVATSVAWLQRRLIFRKAPIEDMVLEINRYNRGIQLHVEGVTPGAYRFSGTFDANDPLSLADLLRHEPGLAVERQGNDIYIRESKPAP